MTCCRAELKTPFCPTCGKARDGADPILGLLRFCQDRVAGLSGSLERWEPMVSCGVKDPNDWYILNLKADIATWTSHTKALEDLIEIAFAAKEHP